MKKFYSALVLAATVSVSAVAGVSTSDKSQVLSAEANPVLNQLEMVQKTQDSDRQKALNYTTADEIAGTYIAYTNSGFDQDDHEATVCIKKGAAADEVIVYGFWNNLKGTNVAGGVAVKGIVKNQGGKCTIVFTKQLAIDFGSDGVAYFYPYDPSSSGGVVDNMTLTVCPQGVSYSDGTNAYEDGCIAGLGKNAFFFSQESIIGQGRGYALWYNIILCPIELYGSEEQQPVEVDENEWTSLGKGTFTDGYVYPIVDGERKTYDVNVYKKNDSENVFMIKNPYGTGTPYAQYNADANGNGYIIIDATNPDVVCVRPMTYSGMTDEDNLEGRFYCSNEEGVQYFMDGSSYDDIKEYFDYYTIPMSTMKKNGNNVTIDIKNGVFATTCDLFTYSVFKNQSGSDIPCESALSFTIDPSGVNTIATENNGVKRFFNLQGVEVANPAAGEVVIVRENGKSSKVVF